MPITLPVEATPDNRSFDRTAKLAERRFAKAGQESGQAFAKSLDDAASKADPKSAERWTKAYDKVADSAGKVRVEEAKLADLRSRGANNTRLISQAEALEKARRAEARATREASNAYKDYEDSASKASKGFFSGIGGAAQSAGQESADSFLSGFAGASALTRLSAAAGPIGLALAGTAGLALLAGKKLAEQIEIGMASLNMQDTFAARIGVDDATMSRYGAAAGQAYANAWGTSVQDNLSVVQFAVQGGLIDADATEADIERIITQIQTVSTLIGEDAQSISRGVRNFIKTGMVDSTEEALDLVVAASQRGLNISGDLLDTFEEYGTKFRDVGLSGADALGLINQLWEAGIRNTDVAADALKEFAISAVDGSDSTAEAFAALGFNADEMAQRFAAGGGTAREAFGEVLTALNNIKDPLQQEIVGTALFKTKWEDAGDAIKNADLATAASELGEMDGATQRATDRIDEHASSWGALRRQIDETFRNMREWLADTAIGRFLGQGLPDFLGTVIAPADPFSGGSATYPGQTVTPAIPGAGGSIAPPSTGAIQGDGTFLDNLLTGEPGAVAPPGLVGPGGGPGGPPITRTDPVPMTPGGAGSGGGGGGITLPYPAEYGQPPQPGETDEQYRARMADILAQHSLAEAQARVAAAQVDDLVAANNALTDARIRADQTARAHQDSLTQQSGIGVPFAPGYAEGPRAGQTAAQYSAESGFFEAQQKAAQALAEYNQLMASGTATTTQLTEAHNELVEAQRNENEALLRLSDTSANTTEKLGEIGAQLDADFGISGGLAGVADNITRFVASLAMAPVIGALKGVQASTGVDASRSGSGLAGIIGGAMGLGGQPSTAGATAGAYMPMMYPRVGPGTSMAPTGGFSDAALLANVPAGRYTQEARGDLTQGLADCTSSIEDLVNLMDGQPTGGASMTTSNAAEWLTSRGFLPTPAGATGPVPGAMNVGFWDGPGNAGHMQATLPGGTPFNWGSNASAANRGIGGTGAFDPALTQRYYRPAGMGPGAAASGFGGSGAGGFAPMTPSQLTSPGLTSPTPLGGGGAGTGGLLPGMAGPPQSMGAAPSTVGGITPAGGRGEGGLGVAGGLMGAAMSALSSAAGAGGMAVNGMAPGAGAAVSAAADIGIKLANRGAQFAGQAAGIGVGGLLETFLPVDSELADPMNSWFGRIVGGMMGAAPNLPNMAGQAANAPQGQGQGAAPTADGRPPITVNYTNQQATEDRAGADLTNHLMAMNTGPGQ